MHLTNGFTAAGGVSLDTAHVRGNVWAHGAILTACEDDAFNAQNARIGGGLVMDKGADTPFCANGTVWLLASRIGSTLQFNGAILNGAYCQGRPDWNKPGEAIVATNIEVGTDVLMKEARVRGPVTFSGARIRGELDCSGAVFTFPRKDRATLFAPNIEIARGAEFNRSVVVGGIDFTGAAISGDLRFKHAALGNYAYDGRAAALKAERARIDGSVAFDHTHSIGELNLSAAVIGRNLNCENAVFSNPARSTLYARDLCVGFDLRLIETTSFGGLNLEHVVVKGRLLWRALQIGIPDDRSPNDRPDGGRRRATINLQHAHVGAVLKAEELCSTGDVRIDLSGGTYSALELHWPQGWGRLDAADGPDANAASRLGCEKHPVNFDGLTYDRIVLVKPNVGEDDGWRGAALEDWLRRQDRAPPGASNGFFPQPYRQLARVLRAQGDEDAARRIAVAEQDERRRWLHSTGAEQDTHRNLLYRAAARVPEFLHPCKNFVASWVRRKLHRLYGLFFGYGLKPARALITLGIYVAIGMAGVRFLHDHGMLVERPIPVAAFASHDEPGSHTPKDSRPVDPELGFRVVPIDEGGMISDLRCTDAANSRWDSMFYAIDMILPFIQLHEENKCEIKADAGMRSWFWRVLHNIYVLIGWVVSSAALLTMSGILRKSDESGPA